MSAIETLMPPVSRAQLGDIEMAYWDVGPRDDPTPVVFCHGFPELAFSWRHQLEGVRRRRGGGRSRRTCAAMASPAGRTRWAPTTWSI